MRANAVEQVGRLLSSNERLLLNITTLTHQGRVLFRLQCDMSTHNWAFVVATHLEKPRRLPSYLSCARTGVSGALCCRGAAFVSHFPASRAAGSLFYSSIRIFHPAVRLPCRFGSPWEPERCPRLHRTDGDISADDEEAADKQRVVPGAQRCRLRLTFVSVGQAWVESKHPVLN